jgi:hypothetical protein
VLRRARLLGSNPQLFGGPAANCPQLSRELARWRGALANQLFRD